MKLSLAWIFEHLQADWHDCDVPKLISLFNQTTAEIESYTPYTLVLDDFAIGCVRHNEEKITLTVPEWRQEVTLPPRPDASVGTWFVLKKNAGVHWATLNDFGAAKDGLIPAIYCPESLQAGGWKKQIAPDDYILELNNTSVTHRADLWGMRGVARECAALLKVPLKDLETLTKKHEITVGNETVTTSGWTIYNKAPRACARFAVLPIACNNRASSLPMLAKLCRIDYRPINFVVDCTNYVMADLGQPLHAFDAAKIKNKTLGPRFAQSKQQVLLLDGTTIELSANDLTISDHAPLSLAGIMGGASSAIGEQTTSIVIEAANFDVATIRNSVAHHKIRTESSARFEKGIDPNQNIVAIQRLLALFEDEQFACQLADPIVSLGSAYQPKAITFDTTFIDQRIGVTIPPTFVHECLTRIGFGVTTTPTAYHVEVPSFRGFNAITIPEDIVEEVARFWGYNTIKPELPTWPMQPHDHHTVFQLRAIKNHLAYGLHMHETNNYPFFDEQFIKSIHYTPHHTIKAKNPLSQNMVQLVDSLVPHLLKNLQQNLHHADRINFFEIGRTWHLVDDAPDERTMLAALWWSNKTPLTFYEGKAALQSLFDMLKLDVQWEKVNPEIKTAPWFSRQQTAHLMHNGQSIGYAGMADSAFLNDITGSAFVCELDAHALSAYQAPIVVLKPLAKYPYIFYDISMLVPLACTVEQLSAAVQHADERIYAVYLLDVFQQEAWPDQKSITLRYYMRDSEKTLTKADAEAINQHVTTKVSRLGAHIRS